MKNKTYGSFCLSSLQAAILLQLSPRNCNVTPTQCGYLNHSRGVGPPPRELLVGGVQQQRIRNLFRSAFGVLLVMAESGELERLRSEVHHLKKEVITLKASSTHARFEMTGDVVDSNPYRYIMYIQVMNNNVRHDKR